MKERIRQIMERAGMSQQDFAAKLGISPASLSSIFTGRTNPTNNHVQAVHRVFPEVNVNWLLFGEGEMYSRVETDSQSGQGDMPVQGGESAIGVLPMFGEEAFPASPKSDLRVSHQLNGRREPAVSAPAFPMSQNNVKNIDIPKRKIKEIRVFFDDGTYEAFVPSSK